MIEGIYKYISTSFTNKIGYKYENIPSQTPKWWKKRLKKASFDSQNSPFSCVPVIVIQRWNSAEIQYGFEWLLEQQTDV